MNLLSLNFEMKLTKPKTMKCCVIENERLIMDSNENEKWNAKPTSYMTTF